ncbi:MAG: hypothetical protein FWE20_10490 [Defluviitaleaceae bacterium]|nr:hypothetical protein [Defluviitaleaceae bacterium]
MPKAKYQLDDFLALVDNEHKDYVFQVHEIMMQEGYKLKIQTTKQYGLHVAYRQPKVKSVTGIIAYFLIQNDELMVRINASNHAKYPDILNSLPGNILSQMDTADDCKKFIDPQKCWTGCNGYDIRIRKQTLQKMPYKLFFACYG